MMLIMLVLIIKAVIIYVLLGISYSMLMTGIALYLTEEGYNTGKRNLGVEPVIAGVILWPLNVVYYLAVGINFWLRLVMNHEEG